jgi:hypothetical protein
MQLNLPRIVRPEGAKATFVKKKAQLKLALPVALAAR